jgi:galactose mutarotase-like enzyme
MYFSIGAHPAFNCTIGDTLSFDENETLYTEKIDLVKSLRLPEKSLILDNEKDIVITKDIFNEDALILSGIKSENIALNLSEGSRKIIFNLGGAPYLGIWAKPGAPYVCIEPWYGVNDSTEKKDDISKKDAINSIETNQIFDLSSDITNINLSFKNFEFQDSHSSWSNVVFVIRNYDISICINIEWSVFGNADKFFFHIV